MPKIFHTVEELIGGTPLFHLETNEQTGAKLLVKLEFLNPGGSIKDRAALSMIQDAEAQGRLAPGGTIIEPTSGNTGIGLACVAASRGYRLILTMPDTMSAERRAMLAAYGAQLVLTPGAQGMQGAVDKAEALAKEIPGSIIAGQFENAANPAAHYRTTGPEIWADTQGQVDALVACVGTGGTVTGTGRYLKEQNPALHVAAVEPDASPLLSGGKAGPHQIQGIGANFIPAALDRTVLDEVVRVTDEQAFQTGRELAKQFGLLVGISSGAAVCAARQLCAREEFRVKTVVAVLPDSGDRYFSSPMFAQK
ncbi:cysteine synthase A [Pseudoflavonifractor phocaeensis]|uniref:cysteine synthase A n=1 Tax=Pseudoflavonifractor phocaeensis TaxID=1870988 RepID=UPI0025A313AF|nr:cysteine synthase A [Pseudoflavonifractor phocaeensis]MDM8239381.1 cysteine synthase A [Pseudoflavonifractor phocaeensis]